ncbi:hypothetical protein TNCV_4187521 [Trichonephila clavipes]|nr:hypothetical protein TNCV_4187521 [Trichonephila clavipes]
MRNKGRPLPEKPINGRDGRRIAGTGETNYDKMRKRNIQKIQAENKRTYDMYFRERCGDGGLKRIRIELRDQSRNSPERLTSNARGISMPNQGLER